MSIVIVMDGSDSTFSEGIDDTDTVDIPSAFTVSELLVLLFPPDLLHIVSTKPRIATKNICHSLSFHMISPKLRLINTYLKPYKPKWAAHFLILQIILKMPSE